MNAFIRGPLRIANNVMIGLEVIALIRNQIYDEVTILMNGQNGYTVKAVGIFNDVWIENKTIILPSGQVVKGAIITVGAIVTKDIPGYAIVGGNSGRVIKSRLK